MVASLRDQTAGYAPQQARSAAAGLVIDPTPVNMYRAEVEEFGRAIMEGRDPVNSGEIGLQSQRVLAACYASAKTGKIIELGSPPASAARR
jgi:predicted dehydrogenase